MTYEPMTRTKRIAFCKRFGLEASHFEAMTDAEYEEEMDYLAEKVLRTKDIKRRHHLIGWADSDAIFNQE